MKNNDLPEKDKEALKKIKEKAANFDSKEEGAYDSHGMHVEIIPDQEYNELTKK